MSRPVPTLPERIHPLRPWVTVRRIKARTIARDPVPWVDVTLLIVLVVLVQTFALHRPGVRVELPVLSTPTGAHYGSVVLSVPRPGFLFLEDERVHPRDLPGKLMAALDGRDNRELVIEANPGLTQAELLDLYRVAMSNGAERVVLATRRPPGAGPER